MLANPVKMVVWDLDETFWSGTLSEGEVAIPPRHADILKQLTARGIVSSICSKNDFETAKRELERHDLWRNFVFPVIAFDAKGPAIAALVESANLRPENVLLIDDNRLNLREAEYYAPGLMTAAPEDILPSLLDLPAVRARTTRNTSSFRNTNRSRRKSPRGRIPRATRISCANATLESRSISTSSRISIGSSTSSTNPTN